MTAQDAKRCSLVARVRYCARCHKPIGSSDKYTLGPTRKLGYYRLTHRSCDDPGAYPKHEVQQ